MIWNRVSLVVSIALMLVVVVPVATRAADYHHVHITSSSPAKGVEWYSEYLGCHPVSDRDDTANCDGVEFVFVPQ
ncbi:uncharacterized protein METZ01_LOCUS344215, partial [marine metagenome]